MSKHVLKHFIYEELWRLNLLFYKHTLSRSEQFVPLLLPEQLRPTCLGQDVDPEDVLGYLGPVHLHHVLHS